MLLLLLLLLLLLVVVVVVVGSRFQIPRENVFLGGSKNFPDSGIRVPLYGAILSNAVINHYTESTCIVD